VQSNGILNGLFDMMLQAKIIYAKIRLHFVQVIAVEYGAAEDS